MSVYVCTTIAIEDTLLTAMKMKFLDASFRGQFY